MLRKIRTVVAIAVIAILTFGFIDFAGIIDTPLLQKIQFGPALLSLRVVTLVCLIAGTLLFGRIYCSVICPLGIFQDFFIYERSYPERYISAGKFLGELFG